MDQTVVISKGDNFHCACVFVRRAAGECLLYVREGMNLPRWLIGNPVLTSCGQDLYKLSNPEPGFIRIDSQGDNDIYFHVGADPDQLKKRIMIAIHEGPDCQEGPQTCLVNLVAWRVDGICDERWQELCARHEKEIRILKEVLEQS